MADVYFDRQDQYEKIVAGLMPGETVIAVYDCIGAGTGFLALTDRRVVLQDNSFVGKKIALTSIPYKRIQTVSFVSDKSMLGKFASTSTIAIVASGGMYEASFRGDEKAKHSHDVILHYIMLS